MRVERLSQSGSKNRRMDEAMAETLLAITQDEPFSIFVTIKELEAYLSSKPRVHISTIVRHFSLKIAVRQPDVPLRRNIPPTKQRRFEYASWLAGLQISDSDIYMYLDECGINLFTRRTQRRAPVGQAVRQRVLGTRMP